MSKCEEHCLKYDLSMGKSEENRRILQTVVPYVTTSRNNDPMDTGFEKSFFDFCLLILRHITAFWNDQKITQKWLLKTGVRLTVGPFLSFLEQKTIICYEMTSQNSCFHPQYMVLKIWLEENNFDLFQHILTLFGRDIRRKQEITY